MHQVHSRIAPSVGVDVAPINARARRFLHHDWIALEASRFTATQNAIHSGSFYLNFFKQLNAAVCGGKGIAVRQPPDPFWRCEVDGTFVVFYEVAIAIKNS